MDNLDKVILDLCGGTGAWSKPYKDAGYDVQIITLPEHDVLKLKTCGNDLLYDGDGAFWRIQYENIYGVLAAPPCTEFAGSGARWWKNKPPKLLQDALEIVSACMNIIIMSQPTFWALENPVGRINKAIGPPVMYFNPCDYGDPYTKKTGLWGNFKKPKRTPVKPIEGSKLWRLPPSKDRQRLRSITPPGFANAFFKANR